MSLEKEVVSSLRISFLFYVFTPLKTLKKKLFLTVLVVASGKEAKAR
jgi:hypothetical protein